MVSGWSHRQPFFQHIWNLQYWNLRQRTEAQYCVCTEYIVLYTHIFTTQRRKKSEKLQKTGGQNFRRKWTWTQCNIFYRYTYTHLSNRFLAAIVVPDVRPVVLVGVQELWQEPETGIWKRQEFCDRTLRLESEKEILDRNLREESGRQKSGRNNKKKRQEYLIWIWDRNLRRETMTEIWARLKLWDRNLRQLSEAGTWDRNLRQEVESGSEDRKLKKEVETGSGDRSLRKNHVSTIISLQNANFNYCGILFF